MKNKKNYNIGLDLGTSSVGWCVTDDENNIIKNNGKNMWGARLFEEAQTAAIRRNFRGARRRLDRRKERINILQSLLQDDMEKEYPNFFPMLKNSYLTQEDKKINYANEEKIYNLFSDDKYNDEVYYQKFPTIYHLRNYLVTTKEKVDIRLVYLAIHHIIKYRGNFLQEGEFSNNTQIIGEYISEIATYLSEEFEIYPKENINKIIDVLSDKKIKKLDKKDQIINIFDFDKDDKKVITNIVNAMIGYKFEIGTIFKNNSELKISFNSEIAEEESLLSELSESANIYESLKGIYSWFVLQDMLDNEKYISRAFIKKYDEYGNDLEQLKNIYKRYFSNQKYKEMFKEHKKELKNYVAYNGKNKGESNSKCTIEELYTYIKSDFQKIEDSKEKQEILNKIEQNEFLKKLNVTDNGAIPYQLHKYELEEILNNQEKYYNTIKENKDKIISLLAFRIPYYVGPLAKDGISSHAWIVRKNNEKILPWTFDEVVNKDETAEMFIKRMTNKCTYLLNEDVMPKQSIQYSKFCVLNELNNLKVNNRHISKDMKKKIYNELFLNKKSVNYNDIKKLYEREGFNVDDITGFSDIDNKKLNSNMSSFIDMKKIFGTIDENNIEDCEKIIYWITIFEDKTILRDKIKKSFNYLTTDQIKKLVKLNYSGWSRLSKKLIDGLKSKDNKETIIEKLEYTSLNFMQIINEEEFGFKNQIDELMPKYSKGIHYKDIEAIPTSPANKRAIWQAVLVVKEIVHIMKCEPQNIFIEFAREDGTKGEITKKRFTKLLNVYEQIDNFKNDNKKLYNQLKAHQSDKEFTEKLYLYFIQLGKSLYSGKPIEIDELSNYQVDHIIPRSYVKDDSIDNKALVLAQENQQKADDLLISADIRKNMRTWWEYLLRNGLITQNKFNKLTRSKMFETDDERAKFVQRQLVETRQITKYVTNLLNNEYSDTKIFALRSNITHNFRNQYKIYKNRNVNDCHHAQDAYIMALTGNILNNEWKGLNEFQYGKYIREHTQNKDFCTNKNGIIIGVINKKINIEKVKKIMEYKDFYISRMLEEQTGAFYNQTLYSPKEKPVIQLKNGLNSAVYGGYTGEQKAYCIVYKFLDKKNNEKFRLIGIPIKVATDIKNKKETLEDYLIKYSEEKSETFLEVIKNKILKNQEYIDKNANVMMLKSDSEIKSSKQLILPIEINELIYAINNENDDKEEYIKRYTDVYEYVWNKLLEKMKNEYKCFESIYLKLQDKKEVFLKLDKKDKKVTINGIIEVMSNSNGNLKKLDMGDRSGRMSKQNFENDRVINMIFIDKSVTGMYERRSMINGVENSCNN